PVSMPVRSELEWCPPGHGDLYLALHTSGTLAALLAAGYHYAFISNADNLGATLDPGLLGYMLDTRLPFLMEVTERSAADRKGGHLARFADGALVLRETAQCREEDLPEFENTARHRYFNTNNIWVDLRALQEILQQRQYILELPLICNV